MDKYALQTIRQKLQKRVHLLFDSESTNFPFTIKQFFHYINNHAIFKSIIENLKFRTTNLDENDEIQTKFGNKLFYFDTEIEQAGYAYRVIEFIAGLESDNFYRTTLFATIRSVAAQHKREWLEVIKDDLIKPLYYYIDEQLDDASLVLYLLAKYKKICEWFRREDLFGLYSINTEKGEIVLRRSCLEFLFDEGIELYLETESPSGVVDFINEQSSEDPLIADTKVFTGNKTSVKQAFNQILQYTMDFNKPFGYLIIYNVSEKDLAFALSGTEMGVPFIEYNDKTVFFIVINLFIHEESASKRKPEFIEIEEKYILGK